MGTGNRISNWIRILLSIFLLGIGSVGCYLSFREGDRQTGWILLILLIFGGLYAWYAIRGKSGFGQV